MRAIQANQRGARPLLFALVIVALLFAMVSPADARTRPRHRSRNPLVVALQPFLLVRSAVHAVADPVVSNAPRVVASAATAPIRVAYVTARRPNPLPPPRAESLDADDADLDQDRNADGSEPIESGSSRPMIAGSRATLRNGIACAPAHAPQSVKKAIWAANTLRRKPYVWGGGHGSFSDRGYDCSGTVSFALHGAGALGTPLPSSEFMRYGERGRGRWITIYSRRGHTFAVIAGLRLDTTDFQTGGNVGPRWHLDGRDTRGYVARHPAGM
jgi:cell wall-associated NlpC family hydrolase